MNHSTQRGRLGHVRYSERFLRGVFLTHSTSADYENDRQIQRKNTATTRGHSLWRSAGTHRGPVGGACGVLTKTRTPNTIRKRGSGGAWE